MIVLQARVLFLEKRHSVCAFMRFANQRVKTQTNDAVPGIFLNHLHFRACARSSWLKQYKLFVKRLWIEKYVEGSNTLLL